MATDAIARVWAQAALAGGGGGSGTDQNAVHYTADTGKTALEKAQARSNINAQEVLPDATAGSYLHSNATTGELEWSDEVNKIIDGELPPKLAVNLTTSDTVNLTDSFIQRTTASSASISSGPASVISVQGNNSTPTHVQGTATCTKTEVATASITFTDPTTLTESSYTLTYDGSLWKDGDTTISLADYGITLTGTAYVGDAITIIKDAETSVYSATYVRATRFTADMTLAKFLIKAEIDDIALSTLTFTYNGTAWELNSEEVDMEDYGVAINVTSRPVVSGDVITIVYNSKSTYGTINVTTPTSYVSTGFNSFNPTNILSGYTIDTNGDIVAQEGKIVGYTLCFAGIDGWVVGNRSGLDRVAYSASVPTTTTTGMTVLTKSTALSEDSTYEGQTYHNDAYVISTDGYIVFTASTMDLICTHPHWSGRANWVEGGNQDYVNYSSTSVNLIGKTLTRNITRVVYTRATLEALLLAHSDWVEGTNYEWDTNYIYYVADSASTLTYAADSELWSVGTTYDTIAVGSDVQANDYGIEYVTQTTRASRVSMAYAANLKDAFRHSVRYDSQTLTSSQQAQARTNIGVTIQDVRTTMGSIAIANSQYYLGSQSSVSVTLPSSSTLGDMISVVFYSGATATTLTVSGNFIGDAPTPTANQRVELNMIWDGQYWALLSNAMSVS